MLNLSQVTSFYDGQKNGKCHFIQGHGSRMGMQCNNETDLLFCFEHKKYGVEGTTAINFLEFLTKNPSTLDNVLKNAVYLSSRHLYENCVEGECDNCYSEDLEFNLMETLKDDIISMIPSSVPTIFSSVPVLPSVSVPNVPMIPSVSVPNTPMIPSVSVPNVPMIPSVSVPNVPMLPSISVPFAPMMPSTPDIVSDSPEIKVEAYGKFFREITHGYILSQDSNGNIILNFEETKKYLQRELTPMDLSNVSRMGIEMNC